MPRKSDYEHFKPEVLRLLQEGFKVSEILRQMPQLAKSTAYDWEKEFRISSGISKTPAFPLPLDPESPLDKIKNALWDIVHEPDGKGVAVQALNSLVKVFQLEMELKNAANKVDDDEDEGMHLIVERRVIHASSPAED
jgi:hypothetical protein